MSIEEIGTYLTLFNTVNSNNTLQNLLGTGTSSYGNYDNTLNFSSILNNNIASLMSSNSTVSSFKDDLELISKLEEYKDTDCTCDSTKLVKDLYNQYTSNTYWLDKLGISSSSNADSTNTSTTQDNTYDNAILANINSNILTETEIEGQIQSQIESTLLFS